jgi:hypothetical protein
MRYRKSQDVRGEAKNVTVSESCGKWFVIAFCINNGIIGTGGKRLCPDQKETLIYWKIGASGLWPC